MLAKKTSKNQITLPKEIVKAFPDAKYFDVSIRDNTIRLMPVKITPVLSSLDRVRDKIEKLGLTQEEVDGAIQWERRRKK